MHIAYPNRSDLQRAFEASLAQPAEPISWQKCGNPTCIESISSRAFTWHSVAGVREKFCSDACARRYQQLHPEAR